MYTKLAQLFIRKYLEWNNNTLSFFVSPGGHVSAGENVANIGVRKKPKTTSDESDGSESEFSEI